MHDMGASNRMHRTVQAAFILPASRSLKIRHEAPTGALQRDPCLGLGYPDCLSCLSKGYSDGIIC